MIVSIVHMIRWPIEIVRHAQVLASFVYDKTVMMTRDTTDYNRFGNVSLSKLADSFSTPDHLSTDFLLLLGTLGVPRSPLDVPILSVHVNELVNQPDQLVPTLAIHLFLALVSLQPRLFLLDLFLGRRAFGEPDRLVPILRSQFGRPESSSDEPDLVDQEKGLMVSLVGVPVVRGRLVSRALGDHVFVKAFVPCFGVGQVTLESMQDAVQPHPESSGTLYVMQDERGRIQPGARF